jgi:hypothetical protein
MSSDAGMVPKRDRAAVAPLLYVRVSTRSVQVDRAAHGKLVEQTASEFGGEHRHVLHSHVAVSVLSRCCAILPFPVEQK